MTASPPFASTDRPDVVTDEGRSGTGDPPAREVLVGVDGSECGLGAVRWAALEAARRNAPLRILHAASYLGRRSSASAPSPELPRARRITAQAYTVALHTAPGVPVSTEVVPARPDDLAAAGSGRRTARRARQLDDGRRRRDGARLGGDEGGRPVTPAGRRRAAPPGWGADRAAGGRRSWASVSAPTTRPSPSSRPRRRSGSASPCRSCRPARTGAVRRRAGSTTRPSGTALPRPGGRPPRGAGRPRATRCSAGCPAPLMVISAGHGRPPAPVPRRPAPVAAPALHVARWRWSPGCTGRSTSRARTAPPRLTREAARTGTTPATRKDRRRGFLRGRRRPAPGRRPGRPDRAGRRAPAGCPGWVRTARSSSPRYGPPCSWRSSRRCSLAVVGSLPLSAAFVLLMLTVATVTVGGADHRARPAGSAPPQPAAAHGPPDRRRRRCPSSRWCWPAARCRCAARRSSRSRAS